LTHDGYGPVNIVAQTDKQTNNDDYIILLGGGDKESNVLGSERKR